MEIASVALDSIQSSESWLYLTTREKEALVLALLSLLKAGDWRCRNDNIEWEVNDPDIHILYPGYSEIRYKAKRLLALLIDPFHSEDPSTEKRRSAAADVYRELLIKHVSRISGPVLDALSSSKPRSNDLVATPNLASELIGGAKGSIHELCKFENESYVSHLTDEQRARLPESIELTNNRLVWQLHVLERMTDDEVAGGRIANEIRQELQKELNRAQLAIRNSDPETLRRGLNEHKRFYDLCQRHVVANW